MAAVSVPVKNRPVTPTGYEVNDHTTAGLPLKQDVVRGNLLKLHSDGWYLLDASSEAAGEIDGIALKDGYNGQDGFDVGVQGEMDGFADLVPGDALYPSASVDGGIDTSKPSGAIARIKAVRTTRIRYNFV
jgi:hypothetical protein